MDVDEDEEDGDEQGHPAGDDLGIHKEAETIAMMMTILMTLMLLIMGMRKVMKNRSTFSLSGIFYFSQSIFYFFCMGTKLGKISQTN